MNIPGLRGGVPVGDPIVVKRPPARITQGGQQPVPANGSLAPVLSWTSGDGEPRRGTLTLTGQVKLSGSVVDNLNAGMIAKVTVGTATGFSVQWYPVPNVVPIVGNRVTVEMALAKTPNVFFFQRGTNSVTTQDGAPSGVASAVGVALLGDDWADQPPPTLLTRYKLADINGPQIYGPAYLISVTLTNTSASPVQVVLVDTQGGFLTVNKPQPSAYVIVPAQSSIGIGPDALGSFFCGVLAMPCVDMTQGPGANYGGPDTAGGLATMMTATGILYPIGPGG